MASKNINLSALTGDATYTQLVFNRVWGKVKTYQASHPNANIFVMAFGDTTQPLPPTVVSTLIDASERLGHSKTYTGYEDITGNPFLRQAVCTNYYQKRAGVKLNSDEIFISDGAQSSSVNIQELFSFDSKVGIQNPAYPSFVEGTLLSGRTLVNLPCDEGNHFLPKLPEEDVDLIYLCFPNNPTGAVATHQQLKAFVDYANSRQAVIIFDASYSPFITESGIPHSIYEIEGAQECAIEICSLSKWANFTGLRVGWCVIPKAMTISGTVPEELNDLWRIRHAVKFWGTANVAQQGAIAALSSSGQQECDDIVDRYLKNARLLQAGLESINLKCFGAKNSPFVWVKAPPSSSSWEFFQDLMESTGIVGVPGCVFGSRGEGFLRLNALGSTSDIQMAVKNL